MLFRSTGRSYNKAVYIYKVLHVCDRWSSLTMSPAAAHLVKLNQPITNTLNFLYTIKVLYVLPMLTLTLFKLLLHIRQTTGKLHTQQLPVERSFISSDSSPQGGSSKVTACAAASNAGDNLTASLHPFWGQRLEVIPCWRISRACARHCVFRLKSLPDGVPDS